MKKYTVIKDYLRHYYRCIYVRLEGLAPYVGMVWRLRGVRPTSLVAVGEANKQVVQNTVYPLNNSSNPTFKNNKAS